MEKKRLFLVLGIFALLILLIADAALEISNVEIAPNQSMTDSVLICNISSSESINNITVWYHDNSSEMLAFYPFETDGINTSNFSTDFSGIGNHLDVFNATWGSTNGIIGGAYQFDGTSDYLNSSYLQNFSETNAISFDFWVKRQRSSVQEVMISKMASISGVDSFLAYFSASDQIVFRIGSYPTNCQLTSTRTISDTSWHHITLSFDGAGNSMKSYIDGSLDKNDTACAITQLSEGGDWMTIGALPLHPEIKRDCVSL